MRKQRSETIRFSLRSSFWFVPVLMVALTPAFAAAFLRLDLSLGTSDLPDSAVLYSGGPDGSYAMLSMIAGSMATIAGVTFSIVIVALTLTASQYGSRLLANFMRDRGNHFVLGTFVAVFTYCMIVMGLVKNGPDEFVPRITVTAAPVFASAAMFVLIYFVHHTATILRVDYLIFLVEKDLDESIETMYPESAGIGGETPPVSPEAPLKAPESVPQVSERAVSSPVTGYIQAIDYDGLFGYACANNLYLRVEKRPGEFAVPGSRLVTVLRGGEDGSGERGEILEMIALGPQRTPIQDVEFSIGQLVEIAIRALSPAVNDTFTALTCIDRLCSALVRLASRGMPRSELRDANGTLRVTIPVVGFPEALDAAFPLIRRNANYSVLVSLLGSLETIASHASDVSYREPIERQAEMLVRASRGLTEKADRREVKRRYETVVAALRPGS